MKISSEMQKITEQGFIAVLVELRIAYREYRQLSWFNWLFRQQVERIARERLHEAVKRAGVVFVKCELTNVQQSTLAESLVDITTYSVNFAGL